MSTNRIKGISKTLVVILLVVVIAVSSVSLYYWYMTTSGPPVTQEITFGIRTDVDSLDPAALGTAVSWMVSYHIHETLITWDFTESGMEYVGGLAESWTWLNSTHVEFNIRQGVKFHCGHELDAYAVEASFKRLLEPWTRNAYALGPIKYFTAVDKYTIIIGADEPYAPMIATLSNPNGPAIVCPECAAEWGEEYGEHVCGTGPYKFVEKVTGERIVLEANDDYWGGRPTLDKLTFIPITDDTSRIIALEAGEVDIISHIPPAEVQRLQDEGLKLVVTNSTRAGIVRLNVRKPPFDNKTVRQAVNYLVDTEAICQNLFYGTASPAKSVITPMTWAYKATEKYYYNVSKGKQMLADAGYEDGFDVTLWSFQGRYMMDKEICEAIAGYLAEANINVNVVVMESGALMSAFTDEYNAVWVDHTQEARAYDMFFMSISSQTLDPDYVLQAAFHKQAIWNHGDWVDQHMIDLLAESRAEFDPEKRREIMEEIQEYIVDEAVCIFTHYEPMILGMKPDVQNVKNIPNEAFWFADAYRG